MGDEAAGALVGSSWPRRLPRVVGALVLLLTAIAVIGQIAIWWIAPVARGSTSGSFGGDGDCRGEAGLDPDVVEACPIVTFQPGRSVGLLFTVRNDGPIPMTVDDVVQPFADGTVRLTPDTGTCG